MNLTGSQLAGPIDGSRQTRIEPHKSINTLTICGQWYRNLLRIPVAQILSSERISPHAEFSTAVRIRWHFIRQPQDLGALF
jgi:hypothetical protein